MSKGEKMGTNNKDKQAKQRPNIENVFILGAGASKAEGAPLQGELFKEFFERCGGTPAEDELKTKIEKFFAEHFYVENKVYPTFEEVLGIIELALRKDEVFKPNPSIEYLQDIRQSLIMMIAVTLDNTLQDSRRYHKDLINKLKIRGEILNTCFIDMNYDILIDNAIIPLHGGNPQYDLDYGIEFTNFDYPDNTTNNVLHEKWHRPNPDKAIKLFKLHGSLNWLYCPTCIAVTLTPKEKGVCKLLHEKEKCSCIRCGSSTIPVIIPPHIF
jgi:NAD-dependent SIR2 family protein deacetylase